MTALLDRICGILDIAVGSTLLILLLLHDYLLLFLVLNFFDQYFVERTFDFAGMLAVILLSIVVWKKDVLRGVKPANVAPTKVMASNNFLSNLLSYSPPSRR